VTNPTPELEEEFIGKGGKVTAWSAGHTLEDGPGRVAPADP
jgi:hypothetical protein